MPQPNIKQERRSQILDAFEIRIPALAMTLGAFVLFVMFLVALDRYEKDTPA